MPVKGVVVTRIAMPNPERDDLEVALSEAADFLLPVARATNWPCRLELVAWLIAIRDTYKKKDGELH